MPHRPEQYGTGCGLYLDLHPGDAEPEPGDVWSTVAGSYYLLLTVRRVRSQVHPSRWRVRCVRMDPAEVHPEDVTLELNWYPRNRQ